VRALEDNYEIVVGSAEVVGNGKLRLKFVAIQRGRHLF
jgi:hypothetical protein